jgi:hypothetical protein
MFASVAKKYAMSVPENTSNGHARRLTICPATEGLSPCGAESADDEKVKTSLLAAFCRQAMARKYDQNLTG